MLFANDIHESGDLKRTPFSTSLAEGPSTEGAIDPHVDQRLASPADLANPGGCELGGVPLGREHAIVCMWSRAGSSAGGRSISGRAPTATLNGSSIHVYCPEARERAVGGGALRPWFLWADVELWVYIRHIPYKSQAGMTWLRSHFAERNSADLDSAGVRTTEHSSGID